MKDKCIFPLLLCIVFNTATAQTELRETLESKPFHKFSFSAQIFNNSRLLDNAVFANASFDISSDYRTVLKNFPPDSRNFTSRDQRNFLDLNNTMILGSINLRYCTDVQNSLALFLEFSYKENHLSFEDNKSLSGSIGSSFGDLLLNFVYFRTLRIAKFLKLKLGAGIGLTYSKKDEYNAIFDVSIGTADVYDNKPAYFFTDNKHVLVTEELYRKEWQLNLAPKIEIDFTRKNKNYFSIVSGLNIIPYNYLSVKAQIIDIPTKQIVNAQTFGFSHINFYIGLGFTTSWD